MSTRIYSKLKATAERRRTRRCEQIQLLLRLVDIQPPRNTADVALCIDLSFAFAYKGETIRLFAARCVRCPRRRPRQLNELGLECDKSFTRSDALAKHLRHQHNKSPPAPGRGGSRKRKRLPGDIEVTAIPSTRSLTPTLSTFAFALNPDGELMDFNNHARSTRSRSPSPVRGRPHEEDEGYAPAPAPLMYDVIPTQLWPFQDPSTGKIHGRSQSQVLYLLMKAKHAFAMQERERLKIELEHAQEQMQAERTKKEVMVDRVLYHLYGYVCIFFTCRS